MVKLNDSELAGLDELRPPDVKRADIDDTRTVKRANPREAITIEALAEHRRVLHDHAFRRLHCNQHLPGAAAYITAEEWDAGDGPPN